jgi:hypothetical protein
MRLRLSLVRALEVSVQLAARASAENDAAQSLEIQQQIESESRKTAWEQTYGRKRGKRPMRGDAAPVAQIMNGNSSSATGEGRGSRGR